MVNADNAEWAAQMEPHLSADDWPLIESVAKKWICLSKAEIGKQSFNSEQCRALLIARWAVDEVYTLNAEDWIDAEWVDSKFSIDTGSWATSGKYTVEKWRALLARRNQVAQDLDPMHASTLQACAGGGHVWHRDLVRAKFIELEVVQGRGFISTHPKITDWGREINRIRMRSGD